MMKYLKKFFSLCLVLALCLSLGTVALAAPVAEATIDASRTGSLDIYKYDFTNAAKDGVWDSSYVSTGVYDQAVNDALGNAVRAGDTDNSGDLGNGETSYGYAVKGVEFTYLRVADIVQFTESAADGATSNHVEVLYGIDKTNGADLLAAIGLADGAGRYEMRITPTNWITITIIISPMCSSTPSALLWKSTPPPSRTRWRTM